MAGPTAGQRPGNGMRWRPGKAASLLGVALCTRPWRCVWCSAAAAATWCSWSCWSGEGGGGGGGEGGEGNEGRGMKGGGMQSLGAHCNGSDGFCGGCPALRVPGLILLLQAGLSIPSQMRGPPKCPLSLFSLLPAPRGVEIPKRKCTVAG